MRTLTFNTHSPNGDAVITLSPLKIDMVAVVGDKKLEDKTLKIVNVLLENGSSMEFYMSEIDTLMLQRVVGAYILEDLV